MKHSLIALSLLMALEAGAASVKPNHRHHDPSASPKTEQTDVKPADDKSASDSEFEETQDAIEAFSDTTDTDLAASNHGGTTSTTFDFDDEDDLEQLFSHSMSEGFLSLGVVAIVFLFIAIILLAPIILIALLLRYMIKRHNDNVTLANKAMETGQPIPDGFAQNAAPATPTAQAYKQRGIRNTALGCGVLLLGAFWTSTFFGGLGALWACYGIGQIVIGKTSKP